MASLIIYDIYKERRMLRDLRNNRTEYTALIAEALREARIPDKAGLSKEDAEKLVSSLKQLPQIDIVKKTITALNIYASYLEEHPEVLKDTKTVREKIIIPIMRNFLYIFAIADSELYDLVEKTQEYYVKRGFKQKVFIPKLLEAVIDKALSRHHSSPNLEP
ncbi:MAG: hypothetical protein ACTSX9_02365 [Candidatus Njordarchaeales archaeon]